MKKKRRMIIKTGVLFLICFIISGFILCGCAKDNEPYVDIYDTGVVTDYFEQIFCRDGKLVGTFLNEYDSSTLTVGVEDRVMPCRIFKAITGRDVGSEKIYGATFLTADGKCSLSIHGTLYPDNGEYAVLQVNIPSYPQVKKIRMVDVELLNNKNEVVTDATTGQQQK